jgi:hypothetical protein
MNAHAWVENTGAYGLQGQMYTNEEAKLVGCLQTTLMEIQDDGYSGTAG